MDRAAPMRILMQDQWFSGLPGPLRDLIVDRSMRREFAPGASVFVTGDPPTGQFAVLEGSVKLTASKPDGKQVIFGIFRPGAWFGHLAVLDEKPRFQDATAMERTRLMFLSKSAFDAILAQEPRYALEFARLICQHIRVAMEMLAESMTAPLPARVAQALLEIATGPQAPQTRITQESLAAMIGVSRQTVNRVLKSYKTQGLIDVRYGRIVVSDPRSLTALARRA
jgi:CRP/FNR family cyclic AMP-dependent transcriptional regulator